VSMWIVLLVASIVILILIGIVIAIQNQQIGRTSRTSFFQEYSADFPKNLQQEILALLQRGRKIEAIKAFRIATNVGLKEAKEAVEAIERGESPHYQPPPPIPTANWRPQIDEMLRQNRKIEAIKVYRQATNSGLKDAKDAVDAIEKELLNP
jgi:ribosomal protein L7/L12